MSPQVIGTGSNNHTNSLQVISTGSKTLKQPQHHKHGLSSEDFPDTSMAGMAGMAGMFHNDYNTSNICCKNDSVMLQNGPECFKHGSSSKIVLLVIHSFSAIMNHCETL
jgi:hypothetical protein